MKTFKNKSGLLATTNSKTVWIHSEKRIYKQFPFEHFDINNWDEAEKFERFDKLLKTFNYFQSLTKKQLNEIDKKREERENKKRVPTVQQFIHDRLYFKIVPKLRSLAACLPDMGYSMGAKYTVQYLIFKGQYSDCSEYAKCSKFRAIHGNFTLKLTRDEFINAENIAGIFTYIYPNHKTKVKKCYWYEKTGEKQYYQLKKVDGFICGDFHALTKEAAKKGFETREKYRKEAVKKQIEAEKQKSEQLKAFNKAYSKALRYQYGIEDSLKVNCEAGTKAFILRCGLDSTKKYRGSFLMKVAAEKSKNSIGYVRRMIENRAKII